MDFGGNGSGDVFSRFATAPIQMVTELMEKARAAGLGDVAAKMAAAAGFQLPAMTQTTDETKAA